MEENKLIRLKRVPNDRTKKVVATLLTVLTLAGPVALTSCTSKDAKQKIKYELSMDCDKSANEITGIVANTIDDKYYIGVKFDEFEKKRFLSSEKEHYIAVYNVDKETYYAFTSYSGKDDARAYLSDKDWAFLRRVIKDVNPIKVVNYDKDITLKQAVEFEMKIGQENKFYSDPINENSK